MSVPAAAQPALVFSPSDAVSSVVSALIKGKRSEALIVDGSKVQLVTATDIIEHQTNDTQEMKVGSLKLPIREVCKENVTPQDMIAYILAHNVRAVPIEREDGYSTMSKLQLIPFVSKNNLKGKTAADILFYPYTISPSDTLLTAQSLIRDHHLPRVVVVDNGKLTGVIDSVDMLRLMSERQRPKRGDLAGEKTVVQIVASSSAFLKNIPTVEPNTPLTRVVELMMTGSAYTVAVQDTEFRGLITPTNILKLANSQQVEGVYVTVSGEQHEDMFTRGVVDDEIKREISKLAKMLPIDYLAIHIKRHHTTGTRVKYGIHARLITGKGMFFAQNDEWDLGKAVHGTLKKIEREVEKKRGRERRR